MTEPTDRHRLFRDWQALRAAARASHEPGPGGAATCICGAAGAGSEACSMLGRLRDTIRYLKIDRLPIADRMVIEELRSVM